MLTNHEYSNFEAEESGKAAALISLFLKITLQLSVFFCCFSFLLH